MIFFTRNVKGKFAGWYTSCQVFVVKKEQFSILAKLCILRPPLFFICLKQQFLLIQQVEVNKCQKIMSKKKNVANLQFNQQSTCFSVFRDNLCTDVTVSPPRQLNSLTTCHSQCY